MKNYVSWESLVSVIENKSDTAAVREALAEDKPVPENEVGVIEENDEVVAIVIGTMAGNVTYYPDSVTFADGEVQRFSSDHERDASLINTLPDYIVESL